MNDICLEIKKEFYECVKSEKLGFNPEFLKLKATNSKVQQGVLIEENIIRKCKGNRLAKCLSEKYQIQSINEKELSSYYQSQYEERLNKLSESKSQKNLIKK
jgi:hypothetical protein